MRIPDGHLSLPRQILHCYFVVDEEHVTGVRFEGLPTEMTALSIYRVADGKIARLMLLF